MLMFLILAALACAIVWQAWATGYERGYRDGRRLNFRGRPNTSASVRPRTYCRPPYDHEKELS